MSAAAKIKEHPVLNIQFFEAFSEGVRKTLNLMANTEVSTKPHFIQDHFTSSTDVTGFVGLVTDQMRGILTVGYSKESIFKIIKNMFGDEPSFINQEVCDAVGELTNQIYGNAKTILNAKGYKFEMSIPSVVQGHFSIYHINAGTTMILPFNVLPDNHPFFVSITMQP